MKRYLISFASALLWMNVALSDTVSDFYGRINRATLPSGIPTPAALADLLVYTKNISNPDFGGFSDNAGPFDREFMRHMLVAGRYEILQKIVPSASLDEWSAKVVAAARANSEDAPTIASFLSSNDAAIRWIGLKHCSELDPEKRAAHHDQLAKLAAGDPFIFIELTSPPYNEKDGFIFDKVSHEFTAPNRILASSILSLPFDAVAVERLAKDGVALLVKLAETDANQKKVVTETLLTLKPSTTAVREIQTKIRNGEILK